ncbi:MAG: osmotically inducible protein OsmC [Opitutaceae bacterium]|nr:osmotically inducible protein OsmC [Opitutaceae bacterium]
MSEHKAILRWERNGLDFGYKSYSRNHTWTFENGLSVEVSAATQFLGDASKVDPEQAFVASLASCHMLTFLAIASFKKIVVESYSDEAVGHLAKNEQGKLVISKVDLYPRIEFAESCEPDRETLEAMHRKAHEDCFLANSVTCEIVTHF